MIKDSIACSFVLSKDKESRMGLIETLTGKTKLLEFKIIFDENDNVGVIEQSILPNIQSPDYIRLWASYQAKMIYNLGFPNNTSSIMAIEALSKIVENDIEENTNCFLETDFDDVIQYLPNLERGIVTFRGEFYSIGKTKRSVKTWLPNNGTEQQAVYSALALMQYSISTLYDQRDVLEVFTKTVRNMIELYNTNKGVGLASVLQVPNFAYLKAIGVM